MPTTLIPTYATGATTKPTGVTVTSAERATTDDLLREQIGDLPLNVAFVADTLSAALSHERCGVHLYRSVAGRTLNPEFRKQYEHFLGETERHVELLEQLVTAMGASPQYVSPKARLTEAVDSKLLETTFLFAGSGDPVLAEMCMLEAVLLAETIDHSNWMGIANLTTELPDGDLRTAFQEAVDEVLAQETEHLTWASDKRLELMTLLASPQMERAPDASVEDLERAAATLFD